jgi:D-arginine dehydrogenase
MAITTDIIVIGGGMAGSSAAYELAEGHRVIVLEREDQTGYHSTGRSAATLIESYGNRVINGLTVASRSFLEAPPPVFGEATLCEPRGMLIIARDDQLQSLEAELAEGADRVVKLSAQEAVDRLPVLDPAYLTAAIFDDSALDLDVHAIQQGYVKGLRARGGEVRTGSEVRAIERSNGIWRVVTPAETFEAPVLVNAGGAWADEIAGLAGVEPLGLVPKRRTLISVDPPDGVSVSDWPMVVDVDEEFYFKPDAGRILASPADETPSEPTDAQPEELDVAIAVARLERATTIRVRRVGHRWAGLRSFFADKTPVAGEDPAAAGFYWLAGQGGYGIMTSPAMAWLITSCVTGSALPPALTQAGITTDDLSPLRLRRN